MFKLKPGNVFEKMNKMNRKQAYTLGAIVIVCLIALISLASFMGQADDESFDNLNARGYDLAQMPFVSDEAEQYLLASKYPDMQNNGATVLYSAEEKEERQAEDAEAAAEEEQTEEVQEESYSSYDNSSYSGSSGRRSYGGRSRGGSGASTQVGSLGSASMGRASGSGIGGSWGAPRGDFSPYRSQSKGKEVPMPGQAKDKSARKALKQIRSGSRAAAGLKEGKLANAKKAMWAADIAGQDAFTDNGIDLDKASGLNLDTNAPSSSGDLSDLSDKISDAANDAKKKDDKDKETLKDQLLKQLYSGLINLGLNLVTNIANQSVDLMMADAKARMAANQEAKAAGEATVSNLINNVHDASKLEAGSPEAKYLDAAGIDWRNANGVSANELLQKKYNPDWTPTNNSEIASMGSRTDEMVTKSLNVGMSNDGANSKSITPDFSTVANTPAKASSNLSAAELDKAFRKNDRTAWKSANDWYSMHSENFNANVGQVSNHQNYYNSNSYGMDNYSYTSNSSNFNASDFDTSNVRFDGTDYIVQDKNGRDVTIPYNKYHELFD